MPITIPCGQCIGCRIRRSTEWATRIHHEASLYQENTFLTLTYSDDKLPASGSLQLEDFQNFLKRLRSKFAPRKIRFFHCGEYGEQKSRAHYHAILFNFDFPDKKKSEKSGSGEILYESKLLDDLWNNGRARIGAVTFESAAYVARYICKKITGPLASLYYDEIDEDTGEVLRELRPEYATMSRRPGIGKPWFDKYRRDIFPHDFVVIKGKKKPTPKAYKNYLNSLDPDTAARVKAKREIAGKLHPEEKTYERLRDREEFLYLKLEKLVRSYEK